MAVRTDLWWRNLVDRKMRLLLRVAAVAFPIVLIFVQIGFYGAVLNTATVIQQSLNADLFLVSSAYINISRAGTFPRARLYQAASAAGVEPIRTRRRSSATNCSSLGSIRKSGAFAYRRSPTACAH